MSGDRAQVFTLEAFLAALVVLAGLLFALQAVVVTPATSGASQAPADAGQIESILSQASESGSLREAVLDDWAGTGNGFVGTSTNQTFFTGNFNATNNFHRSLNMSFDPTVAFNVIVYYRTTAGETESQRMIFNGEPGDGAVRASTVVTVYDHDSSTSDLYAPDVSSGTDLFNVLEVEVVAWRA